MSLLIVFRPSTVLGSTFGEPHGLGTIVGFLFLFNNIYSTCVVIFYSHFVA